MCVVQKVLIRPFCFSHQNPMYFNTIASSCIKKRIFQFYIQRRETPSQIQYSLIQMYTMSPFFIERIQCLSPLQRGGSVSLLYKEEAQCLLSMERRHTPPLGRGESVPLLYRDEAYSSFLNRRGCPFSLQRGSILLLSEEERVSLFFMDRRHTPPL